MEKVSVIMSAYNESKNDFLLALNSIRNQTYSNIEIIVVIDNPNRIDLVQLIEEMRDSRIFLVKNEKNIGLANSMNLAAKIASGTYLARMDADDIAYPERIKKEIDLLNNTGADYVSAWCVVINEDGSRSEHQITMPITVEVNDLLPYGNTICHPTVVFRKRVFDAVGGYRNFPCTQDYDLWLRLYDAGYRCALVEEPLLLYRVRENSISSKKGLQQCYTAEYIKLLSRERKKFGHDSFSPEHYRAYLEKKGAFDSKIIVQWEKGEKEKLAKGMWHRIIPCIYSKPHRIFVFSAIRRRFVKIYLRSSVNKWRKNPQSFSGKKMRDH